MKNKYIDLRTNEVVLAEELDSPVLVGTITVDAGHFAVYNSTGAIQFAVNPESFKVSYKPVETKKEVKTKE